MAPKKKFLWLRRFKNPHKKNIKRGLRHFLLWQCGYYNDPLPPLSPPDGFIFPNKKEVDASKPLAIWVNHSTFLVKIEGYVFLMDPIWGERCSPFSFLGPKRLHHPSPLLDDLECVDYVVISHDHYDHLDKQSIFRLHRKFPHITWIVPLGVKKWLLRRLFKKAKEEIIELDWWHSYCVHFKKLSLIFTAVPAQHFSGRAPFLHNRCLWMGCVVEVLQEGNRKKCFYFAGDTGYNGFDFKEIGKRFSPIDLSFIPIGVYTPRNFMHTVHVNPEEAVKIHKEVGSQLSIGGHWGTFCLANETLDRPPYDLYVSLEKQNISVESFRVLSPGQGINW